MLNLRTNKTPAVSGRDFRRAGSKERVISNAGEVNANSKKDLMGQLAHFFSEIQAGNIDISDKEETSASEELTAAEKKEFMLAAYNDYKNSPVWAEMGETLATDINLSVTRDGFMRRLLERNELNLANRFASIRVRKNNIMGVVMTTPSNLEPQWISSQWQITPEFDITENMLVSGIDLQIEGEQLLQEQYDYGLQSFMVQEDRMWKMGADALVGTSIPLQVFAGSFGPDDLINMVKLMQTNGVTPGNVLMHSDYWGYILNADAFSSWFDPVTKYQLIQTGTIGTLLGLSFITDGFRDPNMQVLLPGEIYLVGVPEQHGGYTDRGPIMAVPTDGYNQGLNARGWYMTERLSMAVVNPYSIVKGRKL